MFRTIETSIAITVITGQITSPDGLKYGGTGSTTTITAPFNILTKSRLTMSADGNFTKGNLEEGDAEFVYQGTEYDFETWCKEGVTVVVDGMNYRMVDARKKPRNYWHVGLKRLRGL